MRKFLLLLVLVAVASVAEGESCAECYSPPEGDFFCGLTTYNGAETCRPNEWGCTLTGSCEGPDGAGPRIKYKWTCAPKLPEKAPYVVASAKVEQRPAEQRKRS